MIESSSRLSLSWCIVAETERNGERDAGEKESGFGEKESDLGRKRERERERQIETEGGRQRKWNKWDK